MSLCLWQARETQARLFNHVEAEVDEQQVALERLRQIASAGWLFMFDLRDSALREARRWADRMLGMRDKEVQTDVDPSEGKMKLPPPPPKLETDPRGAHMPEGFRRLMASFPKVRGMPGLRALLADCVHALCVGRGPASCQSACWPRPCCSCTSRKSSPTRPAPVRADQVLAVAGAVADSTALSAEAGKAPLQAPALVAEFFFHRYGLASLRDWHITELVASLRHHRDETVGRQLESGEGVKDGVCRRGGGLMLQPVTLSPFQTERT